jgi:hypothetical protein
MHESTMNADLAISRGLILRRKTYSFISVVAKLVLYLLVHLRDDRDLHMCEMTFGRIERNSSEQKRYCLTVRYLMRP